MFNEDNDKTDNQSLIVLQPCVSEKMRLHLKFAIVFTSFNVLMISWF